MLQNDPMSDTFLTHKLSQCLQECLLLAQQGELSSLSRLLKRTLQDIEAPIQLAIIGNISSSKSTLVNALLGAEVVGMGMMETTYNVSWIKYGSIEDDIKVIYKNGSTQSIARKEWDMWSNQSAESLKNEVLYLEVTYPNEVLKRINIIDTPGLNSVKGTDSQNTIDFLQKVKPDAVIMVFTKAIAESTMEVLNNFQNAGGKDSFHLSPLNAIGLYAKVDSMWSVDNDVMPIDTANNVIKNNILAKFPQLKKSLHAIFPICSILGLAARTVTPKEFRLFSQLMNIPTKELKELCLNPDFFIYDDITHYSDVSSDDREKLYYKYQLYGIYSIISHLTATHCNLDQLQDYLMKISGLRDVENRLMMHFGDRAVLIKTQSVAKQILRECKNIRQREGADHFVDIVENKLLFTLREMNEYKELEYLSKLYDGDTSHLDKNALEEYKALCGEYGYSVLHRLQLPLGSDYNTMLEKAKQRAIYANRQQLLYRTQSPANAELYSMMSLSYNILIERIKDMYQRKQRAEQDLVIAQSFFYGE